VCSATPCTVTCSFRPTSALRASCPRQEDASGHLLRRSGRPLAQQRNRTSIPLSCSPELGLYTCGAIPAANSAVCRSRRDATLRAGARSSSTRSATAHAYAWLDVEQRTAQPRPLFWVLLKRNCLQSELAGPQNSLLYGNSSSWSWGHYVTSRKVASSTPNDAIAFSHGLDTSSRTVALGSTQPLTGVRTENLLWGGGQPARKAGNPLGRQRRSPRAGNVTRQASVKADVHEGQPLRM
jgi:hypothetical protein